MAVHGEVQEILAVVREIAAALVDPSSQPLAFLEGIPLTIPADRTDLFCGSTPDHQGLRAPTGEQHVQAGGEAGHVHIYRRAICRQTRRDVSEKFSTNTYADGKNTSVINVLVVNPAAMMIAIE